MSPRPGQPFDVATPPDDLVVTSAGGGEDRIVILSFSIAPGTEALTEAESDVVRAIFAGMSNAAIARARGAAVRTVANQVASVFRKLGVQSRSELVGSAALMATTRGTK